MALATVHHRTTRAFCYRGLVINDEENIGLDMKDVTGVYIDFHGKSSPLVS